MSLSSCSICESSINNHVRRVCHCDNFSFFSVDLNNVTNFVLKIESRCCSISCCGCCCCNCCTVCCNCNCSYHIFGRFFKCRSLKTNCSCTTSYFSCYWISIYCHCCVTCYCRNYKSISIICLDYISNPKFYTKKCVCSCYCTTCCMNSNCSCECNVRVRCNYCISRSKICSCWTTKRNPKTVSKFTCKFTRKRSCRCYHSSLSLIIGIVIY